MNIKEVEELMNNVDLDRWFKRFKPYDKYLYMGCEGRFAYREGWEDNLKYPGAFDISLISTEWYEKKSSVLPKHGLVRFPYCPNNCDDTDAEDWVVVDRLPGDTVFVKAGEKGYWGK